MGIAGWADNPAEGRPARRREFVGTQCYNGDMAPPASDDQCHGTVIIHAYLGSECTEPDCDGLDLAHAYRIDCDAVDCRCDVVRALAI